MSFPHCHLLVTQKKLYMYFLMERSNLEALCYESKCKFVKRALTYARKHQLIEHPYEYTRGIDWREMSSKLEAYLLKLAQQIHREAEPMARNRHKVGPSR
jgi:hypothetical protein